MPFGAATRTAFASFIGRGLTKFETPLPHRFRGHDDPTLRQKLLDIAKTERETNIQPHRMADDFRWKAKAFVIRGSSVCFHEAILAHGSAPLPS
jgi:hypothetical protein